MKAIALANSARKIDSRGFFSRVFEPKMITTNEVRETKVDSETYRDQHETTTSGPSVNAKKPTFIKLNTIIGFPYRLTRFSK